MNNRSARRQRRIGVGFLALVVVAAVAVPGTTVRSVPGAPIAAAAPGPPAVGACVSEPIDPTTLGVQTTYVGSGGPTSVYTYPQVDMQPCTGNRFGEVSTIITDPATPPTGRDALGVPDLDPNLPTCQVAAQRYVGLATTSVGPAPLDGFWFPTPQGPWSVSEPSKRQSAAGQHWLACIVYRGASAGDSTPYPDQERYTGTMRNAARGGPAKNLVASCVADADLYGTPMPCTQPHHGEVFADGSINTTHTRSALTASCQQVISHLTGMITPLPAGLSVTIQYANPAQPATSPNVPAGTSMACGVTTTRQLGSSLLGLNGGPIPWQ